MPALFQSAKLALHHASKMIEADRLIDADALCRYASSLGASVETAREALGPQLISIMEAASKAGRLKVDCPDESRVRGRILFEASQGELSEESIEAYRIESRSYIDPADLPRFAEDALRCASHGICPADLADAIECGRIWFDGEEVQIDPFGGY